MKQLGFQPELEVWTVWTREVLDFGKISLFIVEHSIQFEGSFDFFCWKLYLPHLPGPALGAFFVAFCAFCAALSLTTGFLTVAFFWSLAARTACSLWAFRTSGFWFLFAMISCR